MPPTSERDAGDRGEERGERAGDARRGGNDVAWFSTLKSACVGSAILWRWSKKVVMSFCTCVIACWVDASTSTSVRYARAAQEDNAGRRERHIDHVVLVAETAAAFCDRDADRR